MIDQAESLIPLREVPALVPRRRKGAKLHTATLWRWAASGVRGIRLETVKVGAQRCTTRLLAEWADESPKPGRRTLADDLATGAQSGRWSEAGAGKRGDPFRYWRNSFLANPSPMTARKETDAPDSFLAPIGTDLARKETEWGPYREGH